VSIKRVDKTKLVFAVLLALTANVAFASAQPAEVNAPSAQVSSGLSSHAQPAGETLHLVVGRSMFVDTDTRLRRVYIGNPVVLDSVTDTPNRIVITAKAPGVSSLLLSDEMGRSQVYLVISDLDVDGLQHDLEKAYPNEHLRARAEEGRVSVYGTVSTDAAAESILKLASLYSKDVANSLLVNPSHIKQVRLQVRIVEIDRSKLDQFGINLFSGAGHTLAATTTGQFPVTTSITGSSSGTSGFQISDPLNLFFYNTDVNVGVAIKAMEDRQILQILAEPNITTISGQKAAFLSGGEFPYPVVQGGSAGTAATVTIQFRPYGVKLDFTPVVNPDGTIQLKVAPEVSALDYTNSVSISGFTIPALSTRRAETQVELRDGQSFAISGLLDRRTTDSLGKVPVIGELPMLGSLFRSKNINRSTVELVVIVTPTVVDPLTDTTQPTQPNLPIPVLDSPAFDRKFDKKIVKGGEQSSQTAGPKQP
jgi:pilus assembly protein CpaC